MAKSTLDRTGEQRPVTDKGHGTEALGPSGNSDSGSDVRGGPGLAQDVESQRRGGDAPEPEAVSDLAPDAGEDVEDAATSGEPSGRTDEVRQYPSRRRRRTK
jgi:hypothetical protein